MRTLVESLRRLYASGKISVEKLVTMVDEGKISQDEMDYIMGVHY